MKISSYIFFICSFLDCEAQQIFKKQYSDSTYTAIHDCLVGANGSDYYFLGYSATPKRIGDVLLIKTDIKGDTIWTKKYGRLPNRVCIGRNMVQANESIIIAATKEDSAHPNITGNYIDICLIKIDTSDGTVVNSIVLGDSLDDKISKIIRTKDEKFVGVGYANSERSNSGRMDAFIMKFDASFNIIWKRTFSGTLKSIFYSAVESNDGYFYLSGSVDTVGTNHSDDGLIVKTDTSGNLIWSRKINYGFSEEASSIYMINNSLYISGGLSDVLNATFYSGFSAKMDTAGSVLWFKKYYSSGLGGVGLHYMNGRFYLNGLVLAESDSAGSILANHGTIMGGLPEIKSTPDGGFVSRSVIKTDSLFNGCTKVNKPLYDSLLTVTNSSTILQQNNFTSSSKTPIFEIPSKLSKTVLCETATGIELDPSAIDLLSVHPNPVTDFLIIRSHANPLSSDFISAHVVVINQLGQKCFSSLLDIASNPTTVIDLRELPRGLYVLSIYGSSFNSRHHQYKFIKE